MRYLPLLVCLIIGSVYRQSSAQTLQSHAEVSTQPFAWTYTLYNDEQQGSANYLGYFNLAVNAPMSVTGSPTGWDFQTDNASYVLWFNTDDALPYSHDVSPGASLGGFKVESLVAASKVSDYGIGSWNHTTDLPGPTTSGKIAAPAAVTPEPSAFIAFVCGLGSLVVQGWTGQNKRRRLLPIIGHCD
jgi:hypothetical protein